MPGESIDIVIKKDYNDAVKLCKEAAREAAVENAYTARNSLLRKILLATILLVIFMGFRKSLSVSPVQVPPTN